MMQKFLSNLLIFFALSLCALCAFQWVRESHLRKEIADLQQTVYLKLEAIQNLEAQLKQTKEDVTRLDSLRVELSGIIKTNKEEIQSLRKYSEKLEKDIETDKAVMEMEGFDSGTLTAVVTKGTVSTTITITFTACGQYSVSRSAA